MSATRRRSIALKNVAKRRASGSFYAPDPVTIRPPDLKQLVRVYLLDGSSKLLQMEANSTVEDVLLQVKHNMDLASISTHALYLVESNTPRMLPLQAKIRDVIEQVFPPSPISQDTMDAPKILFRSWVADRAGVFEKSVFQEDCAEKEPTSALWLKYMEEVYMTMSGRYVLTEEESIMLGVLKTQSESGDFDPVVHTDEIVANRIASRFPDPIKSRMKQVMYHGGGLSREAAKAEAISIASRVKLLHNRITGMSKSEAQIEFLRTLRTWCPVYGASMFEVDCQYDHAPTNDHNIPPVIRITAAISAKGVFLVSTSDSGEQTIMLHSYSSILKYKAYKDQNILIYWTLKKSAVPSAVFEAAMREGSIFNADEHCDKIYLASESCGEIEFLMGAYVDMETSDTRPLLADASDTYLRCEGMLEDPPDPFSIGSETETVDINETGLDASTEETSSAALVTEEQFFRGTLAKTIVQAATAHTNHHYSDDTAGVTEGVFKDLYPVDSTESGKESKHDSSEPVQVVPSIKLANTMEDLHIKSAASGIYEFSDDDDCDEESGGGADDSSSCGDTASQSANSRPVSLTAPAAVSSEQQNVGESSGRLSRFFKWG